MEHKPTIDFRELNARLCARSRELLPQWFPAGKFHGREFVIGDLQGNAGESLSINIDTGKWADFANDELKGGDLISLFAAMRGIKQSDAARELGGDPAIENVPAAKQRPYEKWHPIVPVPTNAPAPPDTFNFQDNGVWKKLEQVKRWAYRTASGELVGYVVRFKKPDGDKHVVPQTYCRNAAGKEDWKWKSFPVPRPLYGLELLAQHAARPVMVVEGEKAADAARQLVGDRYVVVSWPGGAKALQLADWKPLQGRKLILWPDADAPGVETMRQLAGLLHGHCPEIKIIDVAGQPPAWDAADAIAAGWDWRKLVDWAKPRTAVYRPAEVVDIGAARKEREKKKTFTSFDALWMELALDLTLQRQPIANLNNALKIIEQHEECKDLVWFDEFHQKYFHRDNREWADVDELNLAAWIQRSCGISRMAPATVHEAAVIVGRRRTRNEPLDWMERLTWDGEDRLEHFFVDCFGAPDGVYTRAASRNFWIKMVARAYRAGCKVDNMVVLEGGQGKLKSSALAMIGGKWYAEAHESVTSKDFYMILTGKLVVEIGELDAFNRAEVTRIKQVISCPTDRYRAPYARAPADYPRRCIFVGTTNEDAYLRDTTGARRFWPIKCEEIRLDIIADNREQLFAEAVHAFKAGATWWEMPRAETEAEQEARRQSDVWEEVLETWLIGKSEVSMQEILFDGLKMDVAKQDKATQMRAAGVMRALGWLRVKPHREGGKLVRTWKRGDRLV